MKRIDTRDAVGQVLCHDVTQIIPGVVKDAAFRKGHVIREEDIPVLLSLGKDHVYIWENDETKLHENEAAEILRRMCQNTGMHPTPVKEGKIELIADVDGLFLVDSARLRKVNSLGEMMIATRHGGTAVHAGDKLAGMRVIPLVIDEKKLEAAEVAAGGRPILELLPYRLKKAAVITTGSEVFHGRIQDRFTPIVAQKLAAFGITMTEHVTVDDGMTHLLDALAAMRQTDVDLILCTGGMSVDPDDNTPGAIRASGAQIVTYGAPVLPGAMFLLGYYPGGMPVIGLPGCVMYAAATIFDLVLPRIAAGVRLEKQDFTVLGEGGLCLGCKPCHYPACPFGKAGGRV